MDKAKNQWQQKINAEKYTPLLFFNYKPVLLGSKQSAIFLYY